MNLQDLKPNLSGLENNGWTKEIKVLPDGELIEVYSKPVVDEDGSPIILMPEEGFYLLSEPSSSDTACSSPAQDPSSPAT